MEEARLQGVWIAVIADAKIAWRPGFRLRDVSSNAGVTDHAIFEADSMSMDRVRVGARAFDTINERPMKVVQRRLS